MTVLKSVTGTSIRLTSERWQHIVENHPEMDQMKNEVAETMNQPDLITMGHTEELLAIKLYPKTPVSNDKFLVVVYKESNDDGFVITAYFTRQYNIERKILWKR